jgi:hypothetical protein
MAQLKALTEQEKQQLIEKQKQYIKGKNAQNLTLIAASAFVEGMRDSGYKSTATAIDEFIDNSLQAGATRVDVITKRDKGTDIAIIDDGHGILPEMMRAAVVWGGTDRHDDRKGLGRYGFGLPSAAVNLTRHYDVYSRVMGGEWHKISVKLDDIVSGKLTDEYGAVRTPQTVKTPVPGFVEDALVPRQVLIDGYSRFSFIRASSVVNRQLILVCCSFLRVCHARISCLRVSWSAIRLQRHPRDSTESSISAIFNQLPCLGV